MHFTSIGVFYVSLESKKLTLNILLKFNIFIFKFKKKSIYKSEPYDFTRDRELIPEIKVGYIFLSKKLDLISLFFCR